MKGTVNGLFFWILLVSLLTNFFLLGVVTRGC